jgi:hypothetical protein
MSISASGSAAGVSGWAVSADKLGSDWWAVRASGEVSTARVGNWDSGSIVAAADPSGKLQKDRPRSLTTTRRRACRRFYKQRRDGLFSYLSAGRRRKNRLFGRLFVLTGGGLFSHPVARAVSSALRRFTNRVRDGNGWDHLALATRSFLIQLVAGVGLEPTTSGL